MDVESTDAHSELRTLRTALGPTRDIPPDSLLTVDDVATALKVSRSWVYEHTRLRPRRDSLASAKIGTRVRFTASVVADYIARYRHRVGDPQITTSREMTASCAAQTPECASPATRVSPYALPTTRPSSPRR